MAGYRRGRGDEPAWRARIKRRLGVLNEKLDATQDPGQRMSAAISFLRGAMACAKSEQEAREAAEEVVRVARERGIRLLSASTGRMSR